MESCQEEEAVEQTTLIESGSDLSPSFGKIVSEAGNGIGNVGNGTGNEGGTVVENGVKTVIGNGVGNGIANGVGNGIGNGVGTVIGNGVVNGVGNGIVTVTGNGVGNGIGNGATIHIGNGVGNGIGNGVGNGTGNGVGNGLGNGVGNGDKKVGNGHRLPRRDRHTVKDESTRALEELRLSTIRGNSDGVRSALKKGVSVNQTLQGGWSPLMYACSMGHPDLVELLLQEGANPNFHKELFSPLMAACASTRENEGKLLRCVDLLIGYNVDVNAIERHRISALMFAAKEGHEKLVRRLAMRQGCNLNLQDSQGWTALFWAVNQGRTAVVATLVQAGAKVHIKDRRGQTAFDLALSKGLAEIASILSTQHLSREPPDSLLDPLLDPIVNYADPALSTSLASLPSGDRSDESLHDAVVVLSSTVRHLSVLFASVSYVRLRLQGRPVDLPLDQRYAACAGSNGLAALSARALRQAELLRSEVHFLHQFTNKLNETDEIVPADVIVEKKDNLPSYTISSFLVVSAVSAVVVYKWRHGPPALVWWW